MLVAVGPNFVEAAVVMHSSQVIVAAETAAVVFVTTDANRTEKLEIEIVVVAGSSFVAAEIVAAVVAVPTPVVAGAIA